MIKRTMENKIYDYQNMLELFHKISEEGRKLQRPLNEQEISILIFPPEIPLSEQDKKRVIQNLKKYEFEKNDALENNTECLIPVEPGKEAEAIDKIMEYCKAHYPDVRFEKPEILTGQIKIKIAPKEYADGITTELENAKPSLIDKKKKSPFVTSEQKESAIATTPTNITHAQIKEHTAKLIRLYMLECGKDPNVASKFNLQGFENFIKQSAGDKTKSTTEGNSKKEGTTLGKEMTQAVAKNIQESGSQFKQDATVAYKKLLLEILQNPEKKPVNPSEYFWATEQLTDAQYKFDDKNRLTVQAKVSLDAEYFEIKSFDFKRPNQNTESIKQEDLDKQKGIKAASQGFGATVSKVSSGVKEMINKRQDSMIALLKQDLGYNESNVNQWVSIGNNVELIRQILYALRETYGIKNEETIHQDGHNTTEKKDEPLIKL